MLIIEKGYSTHCMNVSLNKITKTGEFHVIDTYFQCSVKILLRCSEWFLVCCYVVSRVFWVVTKELQDGACLFIQKCPQYSGP